MADAPVFSFPFRLLANGQVATLEQDTPAADVEAVAMVVMTRVSERPLVPSFGIPDPTFHTISEHDVVAAVATFLPEITINSVAIDPVDGSRAQRVTVELGGTGAQP